VRVIYKKWIQEFPISLDEAWTFFSDPVNLEKITPDGMSFMILSDLTGQEMYEGMIIRYKVSPLFGMKIEWVSEITNIQEKRYFIDEQRIGPYALWHHEHHFEETGSGVRMTDVLHYALRWGWIGRTLNTLMVEKQVDRIFEFREKKLEQLFKKKIYAT
jgi:ligand-binding SRPBCC domain-containing protein